jgi:hypothetical protein
LSGANYFAGILSGAVMEDAGGDAALEAAQHTLVEVLSSRDVI